VWVRAALSLFITGFDVAAFADAGLSHDSVAPCIDVAAMLAWLRST